MMAALAPLLLAGCAAWSPSPETPAPMHSILNTPVIDSGTGRPTTVEALAAQWRDVDVVIIGELHGHNGSHLLEARMQAALYAEHPDQVLSLEPFNVDHQSVLDRYLAGKLGEAEMIDDAEAWKNYRAGYRPLVAFAAELGLPVIAANAPALAVRCVGREGPDALTRLDPALQALLPEQPFLSDPAYRERFFEAMGGHGRGSGDDNPLENRYRAQLLRDNTMASRILHALQDHPGAQVLHITGVFHSEDRLGTVALLKARDPELEIRVLTPVTVDNPTHPSYNADDLSGGDAIYLLAPLPPEYLDQARMIDAIRQQFSDARDMTCP
ncbi:hypothetical protein EZI54_05820 [Marinobacter halodurans]|uniref:Haem-binding uptake Tiki superfamily ChaN domain-containing protein n=2 Tax=Marinobacter halodurans TaxID=2528979 RepID=A0ABY1ZRD8_9GAMM|nr:hypothetical protein EZI54_05820 [Marinobacter halodurans]